MVVFGKRQKIAVIALVLRALFISCVAASEIDFALAEQLPVTTFTIADGLARDYVNVIKPDSHGFIWFCTAEGISRFDGYAFTNYGVSEGLPHRMVTDFLETRTGDYLFGTQDGLVQFNPNALAASYFGAVSLGDDPASKYITKLAEDRDGTVWAGTGKGLFHLTKTAGRWNSEFVDIGPAVDKPLEFGGLNSVMIDDKGSLWIATGGSGIVRRFPDGRMENYTEKNGLSQNGISDILQDRDGRMWVGTGIGLTLLVHDPQPGQKVAERVFLTKDGLGHDFVDILFQSTDGRLWVGTRGGLNVLVDVNNTTGAAFRGYTGTNGIPNIRINTITEDADNNLWVGAENGGAKKIPLAGFTSYFEADGLGHARINQVFSDNAKNVYVLSTDPGILNPRLCRFDGKTLVQQKVNLPSKTQLTWGWNQLVTQDRDGDFWMGTQSGIFRYSAAKTNHDLNDLPLKYQYTIRDGLDDNDIFRLFQDSRGDIWFSTLGPTSRISLHHLDRKSNTVVPVMLKDFGIPVSSTTAFADDHDGNLWIGFYLGGVARYKDGQLTYFGEKDGLPPGLIRNIFFDSHNRMWVATSLGGVARVDDAAGDRLTFVNYNVDTGLSSNQVTTVTEDLFGRIYIGTGRGIDRLNIENGAVSKIKHFTTADGLADNFINVSFADSEGVLWFGTLHGLSRFSPQPDKLHAPPSILISGLRIAGEKRPVSALGEFEVKTADLDYTQNQFQIDFESVGMASGDFLRYQYKFEGESEDWSLPSPQRTITLPNLFPGKYQFLVRAVNSDGVTSVQPASVSFTILPPVWRRWWFITFCILAVAMLASCFYIYRIAQLRRINIALDGARLAEVNLRIAREERLAELEEVRSRIATDLHDDIGASLTQIAVLSEVAQAQSKGNHEAAKPLSRISAVSNELVSTMSDIVWSINPAKDHIGDLTQRMRRFAADVLASRSIRFHFEGNEDTANTILNSNLRRETFLIFKESINNIVKHANAKNVWTEIHVDGRKLKLTVRDDGNGFDAGNADIMRSGNGLGSMKRRTVAVGGEFVIRSEPGRQTEVEAIFPFDNVSSTIA